VEKDTFPRSGGLEILLYSYGAEEKEEGEKLEGTLPTYSPHFANLRCGRYKMKEEHSSVFTGAKLRWGRR